MFDERIFASSAQASVMMTKVSPENTVVGSNLGRALEAKQDGKANGPPLKKASDVDCGDWTPANVKGAAKILEHDLSVGLAVKPTRPILPMQLLS